MCDMWYTFFAVCFDVTAQEGICFHNKLLIKESSVFWKEDLNFLN